MCGACVGVCPAYLMTKDERGHRPGKLLTARKMGSYGAVTKEHAHVTFLCMRCKALRAGVSVKAPPDPGL